MSEPEEVASAIPGNHAGAGANLRGSFVIVEYLIKAFQVIDGVVFRIIAIALFSALVVGITYVPLLFLGVNPTLAKIVSGSILVIVMFALYRATRHIMS